MQIMQRMLLIAGLAVAIIWGNGVTYQEKNKKYLEQFEEIQVENFLQKICRTGILSYEELLVLNVSLNSHDVVMCRLEEFQKEQNLEGRIYWYLISWDEVSEILEEQKFYIFQNGSIVRIELYRKKSSQEQLYTLCGLVWKEWDNDI